MVAVRKDNSSEVLWRVAESGEPCALAEVLRNGIDIDAATVHGMTALMRAAAAGRSELVQLLLEHGADPNRSRRDGFTPLLLAAFFGHKDVVKILIQHGAEMDAATRFGTSARMWAAARTCKEVVDYLQKPDKPLPTVKPVVQPEPATVDSTLLPVQLFSASRLIAVCALFVVLSAGVTAIGLKWSSKDTPATNVAQPRVTEEVRPVVTEPTEASALSHEPEPTKAEPRTEKEPSRSNAPQRAVVTRNPAKAARVNQEIPLPPTDPVITTDIGTVSPRFAPKRTGPSRPPAPPSNQLISPSKNSSKSGKVIAWP